MKKIKSLFRDNPALATVLTIATLLRIHLLDFQSMWYEELVTAGYVIQGSSFFEMMKYYFKNPDFHPPGGIIIFRTFFNIFGYSDFFLKLPSALAGIGSVYLIYRLSLKAFNKETAFYASLLMALSGSQVYYSQELRYTSLMVFTMILLVNLYYDLFLKLKSNNKNITKNLIGIIIVGTCSSYFHISGFFFSGFIGFIFLLYLLQNKKATLLTIKVILANLMIVVIFSPWFNVVRKQAISWKIDKTYNRYPELYIYFKKMFDYSFSYKLYWLNEFNQTYLSIFFFLVFTIIFIKYFKKILKDKKTLLIFSTIHIPIICFYIHDIYEHKKFFYEKALIYIVPFYYILLAVFLNYISKKKIKRCLMTIVAITFVANPYFTQGYYSHRYKTNFRAASKTISYNNKKNNKVFILCGSSFWHQYYFKKYNQFKNFSKEYLYQAKDKDHLYYFTWGHCLPSKEINSIIEKHFTILKSFRPDQMTGVQLARPKKFIQR